MVVLGYLASLLIGVSLGLIGGGGSILTVPVLVYIFSISPVLATSYSLFIVGSTSLIGAYGNFRKGQVSFHTALLFGISSIVTVFVTRKFIIPAIPEHLFKLGHFTVTWSLVTMILFAILMLAASISMISSKTEECAPAGSTTISDFLKLLLYGVGIGIVTGLLGAGGGFLLIPALIILVKLPMKTAVGTSLFIIALNSLFGFLGDLGHYQIDWFFLLKIAFIAVIGILLGGLLAPKISGEKLKKGFGWFVLIMGIYIIIHELLVKQVV
ncbi:hypothetical protein SAMN05518672_103229 [Chitinophaga sp. CF118]|uniref:sulfite exporter TauE/SafE family protein n=1 Tax=Chitinophaga sp. CF118 TaxID=1884367 RepID=UPI0008E1213B|nr:sulfite exporter TauE/SafE family protein [Chitinophaga sp. CF118]SFD79068.1 hypothetical protein SAMN05518672_103229 [Chitinophaga sp. CF118]